MVPQRCYLSVPEWGTRHGGIIVALLLLISDLYRHWGYPHRIRSLPKCSTADASKLVGHTYSSSGWCGRGGGGGGGAQESSFSCAVSRNNWNKCAQAGAMASYGFSVWLREGGRRKTEHDIFAERERKKKGKGERRWVGWWMHNFTFQGEEEKKLRGYFLLALQSFVCVSFTRVGRREQQWRQTHKKEATKAVLMRRPFRIIPSASL